MVREMRLLLLGCSPVLEAVLICWLETVWRPRLLAQMLELKSGFPCAGDTGCSSRCLSSVTNRIFDMLARITAS